MENKGKVVGLIVVILIALGFMIQRVMKSNKGGTVETVTQVLVDVKANKLFANPIKIGPAGPVEKVAFPSTSPFSEGNNAYPALQCPKDKTIFALDNRPLKEGEAPPDPNMVPRCPLCGSTDLYPPELPKGQKSMDLPGPVQIITIPPVR